MRNEQVHTLILGTEASQNRHNWITSMRLGLLNEVKPFKNLYHVARTDLDIATLAAIDSVEAGS